MKHERSRSNEVILNSTHHPTNPPTEEPEEKVFSEQQLKMLSRYQKFIPFQKDEDLLWRKMLDGDNIWLKKFRESQHRRKLVREGRQSYFKRLIVNN
jgi:hypothetical protein